MTAEPDGAFWNNRNQESTPAVPEGANSEVSTPEPSQAASITPTKAAPNLTPSKMTPQSRSVFLQRKRARDLFWKYDKDQNGTIE